MAFLLSALKSVDRKVRHFINPNANPTDNDKYAFKLLDNLNVEEFIEFFEAKKVNPNVTVMKGLSLLIKAIEMAHKQKPGLSDEDKLSMSIVVINFLLKQGADINHQDHSGRTALLTACHWGHTEIARLLILHNADLDLMTTQSGWQTNPLVAACFKKNYPLIELLIINGCNVELAEHLNQQQNGYKLELPELDFIDKARNIRKLLTIRMIQEKSRKPDSMKFLANLNTIHFDRMIEMC